MEAEIKEYSDRDLPELIKIWNEVVDGGVAFPQEERLDEKSGREFFAKQDFVGTAKCGDETVGLYILHPITSADAHTLPMQAMPCSHLSADLK